MLIPQVTSRGCDVGDFYQRMDALRTTRWQWVDGGRGLMLAGATLLIICRLLRVRGWEDIARIQTPKSPAAFLWIGSIVTIGYVLALVPAFSWGLERNEYPWCADSVGIPIFGALMSLVFGLPVLILIGWIITRAFGDLPASLTIWDPSRLVLSATLLMITIVFVGFGLTLLVASISSSEFLTVPFQIVALYLILATRAALTSPLLVS